MAGRTGGHGAGIAVIGAGISGHGRGLRAARATDDVVLYRGREAARRPRPDADRRARRREPVDTGFIVFNHANYPHLVAPVRRTRRGDRAVEHELRRLDRRRAARIRRSPRWARCSRSGATWRTRASCGCAATSCGSTRWRRARSRPTSRADGRRPDRRAAARRLLPRLLPAAVLGRDLVDAEGARSSTFPPTRWCGSSTTTGCSGSTGQHQWYTVTGRVGGVRHAPRRRRWPRAASRSALGTPVEAVRRRRRRRRGEGRRAREWERFDEVVFATHSDDTLALLADPSRGRAQRPRRDPLPAERCWCCIPTPR